MQMQDHHVHTWVSIALALSKTSQWALPAIITIGAPTAIMPLLDQKAHADTAPVETAKADGASMMSAPSSNLSRCELNNLSPRCPTLQPMPAARCTRQQRMVLT